MQILFILIGIVGLLTLFFGIKWSLKSFIAKELIEFPLTDSTKEFNVKNAGLYSLCIIGGGYVNNSGEFNVRLMNIASQEEIDIKENNMKPRFRKKMKMGVEYMQFRINKDGFYKIELENSGSLTVKRSMLKTKQLFQSKEPIQNLTILIKETIPITKRVLGIIFIVLGVNMSAWGIILGINPNLFR